jgi:modification methylase
MTTRIDGIVVAQRVYGGNGKPNHNGNGHRGRISELFAIAVLHPLVEIFPSLKDVDEVAFFLTVEDIRRVGDTAPFLATRSESGQWLVIDNRDRFEACKVAEVEVVFREWSSPDSLAETVARLNLPGARLNDSQLACVAVPIAERIKIENSDRQTAGLKRGQESGKTAFLANPPVSPKVGSRGNGRAEGGETDGEAGKKAAEKAAKICHISRTYVEYAQKIHRESPSLFNDVRTGKLNLSEARLELSRKAFQKKISGTSTGVARRKSSDELITVGDCLLVMPERPRAKYTIAFLDPPYNNGTRYDADPTRDKLPDEKYLAVMKNWFCESAQLLTPSGSMFVMIDDRYSDCFGMMLREMKDPPLYRRNTIVWWEDFPQYRDVNFVRTVRYIHYYTRSEKNFIWNKEAIEEPSARTTRYNEPRRVRDGRVPDNVWVYNRISNNDPDRVKFNDAPPQIPDALLRRCILVASNEGDTVFDPCCGNGTTGRAAIALNRKFLGIERSPLYAAQARAWICSAESGGGAK